MTKTEFIFEFAGLLGISPDALTPETEMSKVENWDSVAYLSALVLIDEKLGIALRPEVLSGANKFGDILKELDSALKY
jgi:acyl carrier protein